MLIEGLNLYITEPFCQNTLVEVAGQRNNRLAKEKAFELCSYCGLSRSIASLIHIQQYLLNEYSSYGKEIITIVRIWLVLGRLLKSSRRFS